MPSAIEAVSGSSPKVAESRTYSGELVAAYPQLAAVQQVLSIAVNSEYAGSHTALQAGDEVALIPPVSGG